MAECNNDGIRFVETPLPEVAAPPKPPPEDLAIPSPSSKLARALHLIILAVVLLGFSQQPLIFYIKTAGK